MEANTRRHALPLASPKRRYAVEYGPKHAAGQPLMAILGGFRTDQLIGTLVSETDTNSPVAQKTIERLKKIGPKVIPKIIDALAMSDKSHTMVFVDILASYVSDKTLKFYQEGLSDGGERVVSGTAWALSSSNNYNANALLDFSTTPKFRNPP